MNSPICYSSSNHDILLSIMPKFLYNHVFDYLSTDDLLRLSTNIKAFGPLINEINWKRCYDNKVSDITIVNMKQYNTNPKDYYSIWHYAITNHIKCNEFINFYKLIEADIETEPKDVLRKVDNIINPIVPHYRIYLKTGVHRLARLSGPVYQYEIYIGKIWGCKIEMIGTFGTVIEFPVPGSALSLLGFKYLSIENVIFNNINVNAYNKHDYQYYVIYNIRLRAFVHDAKQLKISNCVFNRSVLTINCFDDIELTCNTFNDGSDIVIANNRKCTQAFHTILKKYNYLIQTNVVINRNTFNNSCISNNEIFGNLFKFYDWFIQTNILFFSNTINTLCLRCQNIRISPRIYPFILNQLNKLMSVGIFTCHNEIDYEIIATDSNAPSQIKNIISNNNFTCHSCWKCIAN